MVLHGPHPAEIWWFLFVSSKSILLASQSFHAVTTA